MKKALFLEMFLARRRFLEPQVPPQEEAVGDGHVNRNRDPQHPEGLRKLFLGRTFGVLLIFHISHIRD